MAEAKRTAPGKRERMLNSLYNYTSGFAESNPGRTRGVAAGTAATFLGMGIDHIESSGTGNGSGSSQSVDYTDEEIEAVRAMALSAEEEQEKKADRGHFMDRFMEKLMMHTMPADTPDYEDFQSRMKDTARSSKPPLSLRVLGSNLKQLSSKMGAFFKLQYGLIGVFTWKKPTKTISALVVYTAVCLWPHLVLAFPLLFVLFGIIVPAYLHRHPRQWPEIIKVKKRGQSLLEYLSHTDETSVLEDILRENNPDLLEDDEVLLVQSLTTHSSTTSGLTLMSKTQGSHTLAQTSVDIADRLNKKDRSQFVKKQVSTFLNMRDLQNLTTDLLKGIDQAEAAAGEAVGFNNERLSTVIFYAVVLATSVVLFLGQFIPWRIIFIQSGWVAMGLCHPKTKKYIERFKAAKARAQYEQDSKLAVEKPAEEENQEKYDREDIIVDEKAQVRMVEIYELQYHNVLKNEWVLYAYTKRVFDFKDTVRLSGKKPHGVDSLTKVRPPVEWKFDFGYANNWRIDQNPRGFIRERTIDDEHLKVKDDEEDGWIYDDLPPAQDNTMEFRRRRLYRECYRYARPAMKMTFE